MSQPSGPSSKRLLITVPQTTVKQSIGAPADGSLDSMPLEKIITDNAVTTDARRIATIRGISRFPFYISTVMTPIYSLTTVISGSLAIGMIALLTFVAAVMFGFALHSLKSGRITTATVIVCSTAMFASLILSVGLGFDTTLPVLFITSLLIIAMLVDRRVLLLISAVTIPVIFVLYITQAVFGLWHPIFSLAAQSYAVWVNALVLVICSLVNVLLLAVFVSQFDRAMTGMVEATQLRDLHDRLHQRYELNQHVSSTVQSLAMDLATATRQQVGGSTEQVAAVVQVTTSMEELSETARQIATNTADVSHAAESALDSATQVKETTERAATVGETGRGAVDAAIFGIETVRDKIENLATKLLLLAERSQQISAIIELITSIADETHLLSLNAAIESAGAGESGARFSVIANEVKGLADRSLEATREVRGVIADLQAAIAAAVLAAEEGKKETVGAVELAYQAGEVIGDLGTVIETASGGAHTIVNAVATVVQLAEEIALATRQQQSASDQVVLTLRSIGQVAREVAAGNTTINQAVTGLQDLSAQLVSADA